MEQMSFEFSKIPIEIVIELAFEMGMAYKSLWIKADLDNAVNFNHFQHSKGCGGEVKLKGTMEDLSRVWAYRTDKEKEIIIELNKIVANKKKLISLCKY